MSDPGERSLWFRRALALVIATMAYNFLEAGISLWAGVVAASVVLVGFGLDSVIEMSAAAVVLWRLAQRGSRGECEEANRALRSRRRLRRLRAFGCRSRRRRLTSTSVPGGKVNAMLARSVLPATTALLLAAAPAARADLLVFPERPADARLAGFERAIEMLHQKAARSREPWTEEDLRRQVPKQHLDLEARYEKGEDRARATAMAELALLYAELAWVERVRPLEEEIAGLDPDLARRLGRFEESEHFLARVVGAGPEWGKAAVRLGEAAREGYEELFGLRELSKTPGKKVRILIHVDPSFERPRLYFHPGHPYHSELRYEVPDERYLRLEGKQRIVYGFCHELGHMLAMWGEHQKVEDDRHQWAHYTGCTVVDEVYERLGNEPWPTWTAFQRRASGKARLLRQVEGQDPGLESDEAVLALLDRKSTRLNSSH